VATFSLTPNAQANGLILGQPLSQGTGCPDGSVGAVVSPDGNELSVLFDRYIGEAGGTTARRMDRKNCHLSIPVQVPAGVSAALVEVDYRGFNNMPARASTSLFISYSLGTAAGPRFSRRFVGALNGDFLTTNKLRASDVRWTACGANTILKIDSELVVATNGPQDYTTSGLDSADLKAAVTYEVQYRDCR